MWKLTPLNTKIFDSQVPWDVEILMSEDALFQCRWCRIILILILVDAHKKHWPLCNFSCDQAAQWMVQSVCWSVCLSVTPFYMPVWKTDVLCHGSVRPSEFSVLFHASAFRCQRHYVFGLSVRPKPEIPSFDLSQEWCLKQGHTALKIVEFDPNWAFPD